MLLLIFQTTPNYKAAYGVEQIEVKLIEMLLWDSCVYASAGWETWTGYSQMWQLGKKFTIELKNFVI